ncbi:MDR family MFS transporter [Lichenifustis flavocetrariae]|uniref:Multidrug efflux MFS transporter n=1 Tax=Lichenifustis flavocetrariae TaxID=2949735 RepID=A0AA42CGU7_9HYPH|nr:MDR family MFS transporter [Lichenifustis flavocetrariae]MCW6506589.1 multidrug efflux MFS transporter [Lichenifustis flavocetrariae]
MPNQADATPIDGLRALPTAIGFMAMCVGMFMAILDVQVVATALPTIQSALTIAPSAMSWLQTAYLIAEVVAIPLTGLLTRALSMRWLFVGAVSLFTLASIGCAASAGFASLVAWRIVQGFAGGTLIPSVFAAVFVLFPVRQQALATTLAGVLAVLAPTVGPVVGGWITQTYSWHWLFLINVLPGVAAAVCASLMLPRGSANLTSLARLDAGALALLAVALASLEIGLKQAPQSGWGSLTVLGLLAASVASLAALVRRTLAGPSPLIDFAILRDRSFAIGCLLSFVLGIGLFGTIYLMPVFLALVRGEDPLEIGKIMLVTGVAQLLTAPVAIALERRIDGRILTVFGFLVFGLGLSMSTGQDGATDYDEMFWPQVVRGSAIMFCLLPPTRLALGHIPLARVPDASGLFNLMRNLGGAVGLALIDSVIYGRVEPIARGIRQSLLAGDAAVAVRIGIPLTRFLNRGTAPLDAETQAAVAHLVERAALIGAINEAWMLIALLTLIALVAVPFAGAPARPDLPAPGEVWPSTG